MRVVRNTYPIWEGVAHGEVDDEVEWKPGRGKMHLERLSDGKSIFSRDCLPKDVEDHRPMVGVITEIKSKGWVLEIKPNGEADFCERSEAE